MLTPEQLEEVLIAAGSRRDAVLAAYKRVTAEDAVEDFPLGEPAPIAAPDEPDLGDSHEHASVDE